MVPGIEAGAGPAVGEAEPSAFVAAELPDARPIAGEPVAAVAAADGTDPAGLKDGIGAAGLPGPGGATVATLSFLNPKKAAVTAPPIPQTLTTPRATNPSTGII